MIDDEDGREPRIVDWITRLEIRLRWSDDRLRVLDFDLPDGTVDLRCGRELGEFEWERVPGIRAVLQVDRRRRWFAAMGGESFISPELLADRWLALIAAAE